jgi:hypothetical protein
LICRLSKGGVQDTVQNSSNGEKCENCALHEAQVGEINSVIHNEWSIGDYIQFKTGNVRRT